MQCLYCNRHLGFFNTGKGPFCSEKHEELYGKAAMGRLDAPYDRSSGSLASSEAEAEAEAEKSPVEDLSKLLTATQQDSGIPVETPAQIPVATASAEAVPIAVGTTRAETLADADSLTAAPQPHAGSPAPPDSPGSPMHEFSGGGDSEAAEEDAERRGEPRVKAIAIVKIASLRDADREITCALVDKSETGIQFTSLTDINIGEILIAELPDQLVLVEVKHSQAAGDKFAIGAERVQTASKNEMPPASAGMERADVLIKALCDRVRTGFSETGNPEADEAAGHSRAHALERVARILEIWQNTRMCALPEADAESETESVEKVDAAETKHSIGAGRIFGAVAAALVITGLVTLYIVQVRKGGEVAAPKHVSVAKQIKPQQPAAAPPAATVVVDAGKQTAAETVAPAAAKPAVAAASAPAAIQPAAKPPAPPPAAAKPAPAAVSPAPSTAKQTSPAEQHIAAAAPGQHHVQIKAIQTTWVGVSADGHKLFGVMIPKGTTKELEYSKYAFVHTGNAVGVEILLDGQPVPMGDRPSLRLVELTGSGSKILRWSNDDPPQP